MANITVNTPSPSADTTEELRAIWEHIIELENQLMNVLANLDGENFSDEGIKELKKKLGL